MKSNSNYNGTRLARQRASAKTKAPAGGILPEFSKFDCLPGRAGGTPISLAVHSLEASVTRRSGILLDSEKRRARSGRNVPNRFLEATDHSLVNCPLQPNLCLGWNHIEGLCESTFVPWFAQDRRNEFGHVFVRVGLKLLFFVQEHIRSCPRLFWLRHCFWVPCGKARAGFVPGFVGRSMFMARLFK